MSSGERVLVTGGFGAIGSLVLLRLVADGHHPVAYSRRESYALVPELRGKVTWAPGDVEDAARIRQVIQQHGVRRIIHLAAALPPLTETEPIRGYQVNLVGGMHLLEAVRDLGLDRLVYASSKAYYGVAQGEYAAPTYRPVTEDYVAQTSNFYGATKKALEDAAYHYRRLWGVDAIGLRLGSTYGPGKGRAAIGPVGYHGMKTHVVEATLRGEPVEVPWGDVADDLVYNGDVAKGAVLAAFAPKTDHEIFNISGNELVTLRAFAEAAMQHLPDHRITVLPTSPDDPPPPGNISMLLSIDRARAELGYEPDHPGVHGIAAYLDRMRQVEAALAHGA